MPDVFSGGMPFSEDYTYKDRVEARKYHPVLAPSPYAEYEAQSAYPGMEAEWLATHRRSKSTLQAAQDYASSARHSSNHLDPIISAFKHQAIAAEASKAEKQVHRMRIGRKAGKDAYELSPPRNKGKRVIVEGRPSINRDDYIWLPDYKDDTGKGDTLHERQVIVFKQRNTNLRYRLRKAIQAKFGKIGGLSESSILDAVLAKGVERGIYFEFPKDLVKNATGRYAQVRRAYSVKENDAQWSQIIDDMWRSSQASRRRDR
ncbi:hypothetical protein CBS101457_005288 [Exobasidium rhododendri]|nr:hypothetical protein CBS101457_005288 [Exobasidium rhododendri]